MLKLLRNLASAERSAARDRILGAALAFVAGAINAGGLLAVGRYTSHMTGIVAGFAGDLVAGRAALALAAAAALASFVSGAMSTAILVNWARRRGLRSQYALPLLFEALLLLTFGSLGSQGNTGHLIVPVTLILLCYMMGLQNAVITKISQAEIRTTHVTGLVTDIGIELGRALYINRAPDLPPVAMNRARLSVHLLLFGMFVLGSIAGAAGFAALGYVAVVPLVLVLVALSWSPVYEDLAEVR